MPRVLACGLFGLGISWLHSQGIPVAHKGLGNIVPGLVLGLLLVFRTNTAYERFWEGRKLWGSVINTTRNLARKIWVFVQEKNSHDRQQKKQAVYLLVAFAVAMKQHLRQEPLNQELEKLVSPEQYSKLITMNHPSLEIAFWINDFLKIQHDRGKMSTYEMISMVQLLNQLVDYLGACERILKTPMPLAYSIHLKQLLMIYCLILPFELVGQMGWMTGFVVSLTSFTLLGIEEIGLEIENPFGRDPNDLPLDTICDTMYRNLTDLISLSPSTSHWIDLEEDGVKHQESITPL